MAADEGRAPGRSLARTPAEIAPPFETPSFARVVTSTRRASSVALVIVALITAVACANFFAMWRSTRWVEHTHQVLSALSQVMTDVRDMELGRRTYLFTGDTTFLSPYRRGHAQLAADLQALHGLTGGNALERAQINALDTLVYRHLASLPLAPLSPAAVRVEIDSAFLLMRTVRRMADAAAAEERSRLSTHIRDQQWDTWWSGSVVLIGFISAIALVAWSNRNLLRALQARERAEREAVLAREQAEAASRAKSDFLARMSHELRTPLNSVIGFANVLLKNREGRLVESDITYLDRIQANGRHLLSLINQILDLSKIESGRMELEMTAVDIGALVHEVVAQLEPQVQGGAVELRAVVPKSLRPVQADAEKLRQILLNLIGNAVKFTERGNVTVTVTARRGVVGTIAVRDTGVGIPSERIGAIFDPFEQAETSTARRFGGTGLGLSIARSLAQLMGLELTVESTVGEGTVFMLLFPSRGLTMTPVQGTVIPWSDTFPTPAELELLHDKLVLVVDDDPDARMVLARYLEDFGCRVIAATNGEQGLRMANGFSPDAILLDLQMPGVDGLEVLRRLQADPALQRTPAIVVSVVAKESRDRVSGAVALIDKPCTRDELAAALGRVLRI